MMEVVILGAVTSLWWISSVTILLPFLILLKYNKFFRDWWFSFVYKNFQPNFEHKVIPMRKKAFNLLKDKLSGRDVSKPLKVLEIGIGCGENLQFYPENSHLIALDMNANFESYFYKNKKKYPQVLYEKIIISVAENMKEVEDSSMDIVVSTYVICSVTSVQDALKEVKRVLKPGGKFLFLEHVCYPKSEWSYTLQNFAGPLWTIYCDGCCLLRDIEGDIMNAGFSDVICHKIFPNSLPVFVRPQIYGLATK